MNYAPSFPIESGSPTQVNTDGRAMQRAAEQNPDYVPSDYRRRLQAAGERRTMSSDREKNWMPQKIINEGVDYRSGKDQAKLTEKRKGKLDLVIRSIFDTHREAFKRYKKAKAHMMSLTPDQRESPSVQTKKAKVIVDKGPPITKKQAEQDAWERVVRHG